MEIVRHITPCLLYIAAFPALLLYSGLILQTEGMISLCTVAYKLISAYYSQPRIQYAWLQLRQYCLLCLCCLTVGRANLGDLTLLVITPKPQRKEAKLLIAKYNRNGYIITIDGKVCKIVTPVVKKMRHFKCKYLKFKKNARLPVNKIMRRLITSERNN